MTVTVLKAILVIVILVLMILLLLSMNHFLRGNFDNPPSEMDHLRKDVEERDDVITDESAFKDLVKVRHKNR